ncbi:MAG: hypothetical protein ACTSVZ_06680 [Promethearchaeota archaeon]
MDPYEKLPDLPITPMGEFSRYFLDLKLNSSIKTFKEACLYVHHLPYGYNTERDDKWSLFDENMGSCTTKHGVIATLAEELGIRLHKHIGIYKFTEDICMGTAKILEKYQIPYIPMIHCFLVFQNYQFDLTEGNLNGKERSINDFIHEEEVIPFITNKDEYLLFKRVLREKIMHTSEMHGILEKTTLKAREEAILLLHAKVGKTK